MIKRSRSLLLLIALLIAVVLAVAGWYYIVESNSMPQETSDDSSSTSPTVEDLISDRASVDGSKPQLFWRVAAGRTVNFMNGSVVVGTVSQRDGQMVGDLAIQTATETRTITVIPPDRLKFSVGDNSFEICIIGQSVEFPAGEVSFSVASGNATPLCPNAYEGESPSEPKFHLAQ